MSCPPSTPSRSPLARWELWALAGLWALAAALRGEMACRVTHVYPDGASYLRYAEAWRQGDLETALRKQHLNLYPLLLAGFDASGLEMEAAGRRWGVFIGGLTVLPLVAWLRRQFGARTAWLGGLLFAVHPRFVAWSPEIVRDPTFWFLACVVLWLGRKAADERSPQGSAAACVAGLLAAYVRTEGWLLFLPLAVWSWRATRNAAVLRARFALAGCGVLAAWAALLIGVNLTLLRGAPRWEFGDGTHLRWASEWFASWTGRSSAASEPAAVPHGSPGLTTAAVGVATQGEQMVRMLPERNRFGLRETYWALRTACVEGFTWPGLLLAGLGVGRRFRQCFAADVWPLFAVQAGVVAGLCLVLRWDQALSHRQGLSVVLLALPWLAAGLADLLAGLTWVGVFLLQRSFHKPDGNSIAAVWLRPALAAGAVLVLTAGGAAEAWRQHDADRAPRVALARWLCETYGPGRRIGGSPNLRRYAGYYANARYMSLPEEYDARQAIELLGVMYPEIVLLWNPPSRQSLHAEVLAGLEAKGLRLLPTEMIPAGCGPVLVAVREGLALGPGTTAE